MFNEAPFGAEWKPPPHPRNGRSKLPYGLIRNAKFLPCNGLVLPVHKSGRYLETRSVWLDNEAARARRGREQTYLENIGQ